MAYLWMMTIGFVICLGLIGGTLMFFISGALKPEDANVIDLLDTRKEE